MLEELLDQYWSAAHAEGKEGRNHDTEDGLAQRTLNELRAEVQRLVAAEREACAKMLELPNGELLLMAGEMTKQELRTVRAVLTQRASAIRNRRTD
jgi:hypothetical protein